MTQMYDYWQQQLQISKRLPLEITLVEQTNLSDERLTTYQVTYTSLGQVKITGWLIIPANQETYPLVIDYLGYMTQLQNPMEYQSWIDLSIGVLAIDMRGQGGMTPDIMAYVTTQERQLLARGCTTPDDFYLRRLYWDALRLVDVAFSLPQVDQQAVFIHGTSQGGGLAVFVASLTPHPIRYTFANVPSHSNIENRVVTGTGSYREIKQFIEKHPMLLNNVLETLNYFDTQFVAQYLTTPILVSVGVADPICPKEDFYPTYGAITAPKELICYPETGHGGGGQIHLTKILMMCERILGGDLHDGTENSNV